MGITDGTTGDGAPGLTIRGIAPTVITTGECILCTTRFIGVAVITAEVFGAETLEPITQGLQEG